MDNWLVKKTYQEQHHDRLLQTAANERLLRQANATPPEPLRRKESNTMFKRQLIYLTGILIAFTMLLIMAAL